MAGIDPQLQRMVTQKVQMNQTMQELTEKCWDVCMNTPSHSLDNRTQTCVKNCVQRFLDSSNFVYNRLAKEGEMIMAKQQQHGQEFE